MKRIDKAKRNIYYHCLEYDHEQLGDLYLIACGMEDADPGVITGPDVRDGFHLHVVRSGKGILRIDGEEQPVHEGQMFILKDGEDISAMPVEYAPTFTKKYNPAMAEVLGMELPEDYEAIEAEE